MKKDRRFFLKRLLSAGVLLGGGLPMLVACGGGKGQKEGAASAPSAGADTADNGATSRFGGNCDDFSKLTEADYEIRERLGYEKTSPSEETQCQHCNLWLPPRSTETCGGCTLFTGPIEPTGTCTYWAPRQS
ncbi:hypothetical protein [Parapedobacter sp. 10938]|uniref:hypothetical protein n=1 Tax=Parapedobacter flavus TaxID=3110225 RepID=UPI002DB89142|nr:hypothetical protein [Parapedobacter sp. 10938]MEC3878320.1 hypothetical protein [Parapedobacter sp. 10938]